jgi:hypothetical protein
VTKTRVATCLVLCALYGCDDKAPTPDASKQPKTESNTASKPEETAGASTVEASFDSDNAFVNPSGDLSLVGGSLSLTLRTELDAPIKLSAPYPKAEKHARFEYQTKDGKVVIGDYEFEVELESSSMTPARDAFIIPIDAPDLKRSAPAVPDILFWSLEVPTADAKGLGEQCGKDIEVTGSGTIVSPKVMAISDLIAYRGDAEIPVRVSAKLSLTCE